MTSKPKYNALIVDDEPAICRLLSRVLREEGFRCDLACDGAEAVEMAAGNQYHLVLTDLKMPNLHGHALAMQLLTLKQRPAIVVHTGVVEPRLARDLLIRGVDDIVFKPADTRTLAVKARLLVERRYPADSSGNSAPVFSTPAVDKTCVSLGGAHDDGPISMHVVEERLQSLPQAVPISQAAIDVYQMTISSDWTVEHVAAAIQRDAALTIEVLRLANSAFYNPSGVPIVQLERAVVHIGQKRIGELALAISVLSAFTSRLLPWMDMGLIWRRSLAGGVIAESLERQNGLQADPGVLLGAIMYPLGRVTLATLFPEEYARFITRCRSHGQTICEFEESRFPIDVGQVLARLLEGWEVPSEIFLPLHCLHRFQSKGFSEAVRRRAELIKLSVSMADFAVGRWEPWDHLEPPSAPLLARLKIADVDEILRDASNDVERLANFQVNCQEAELTSTPSVNARRANVCELVNDPFNTITRWLKSMHIESELCRPEELSNLEEPAIVNCCGIGASRLAEVFAQATRKNHLIVTTASQLELVRDYGRTLILPDSYARLRTAFSNLAR
jgi:DNA-binding response OmpR family regulator